jgi:hypothetical protein
MQRKQSSDYFNQSFERDPVRSRSTNEFSFADASFNASTIRLSQNGSNACTPKKRRSTQKEKGELNFSGIAPVLKRSGQATTIHRRYARPLFLHQSFIEYANESIRHSLWAHAFYQMQKAATKTHWVIIRALAYKWIRILFRCWQARTPYDEVRYLKSLQKRRSPFIQYLTQPTTETA